MSGLDSSNFLRHFDISQSDWKAYFQTSSWKNKCTKDGMIGFAAGGVALALIGVVLAYRGNAFLGILLVITGIILGIVGGAWYYSKHKNSKPSCRSPGSPGASPSPSP